MMHESNEITCFSWITNLIPSKPPLKQFPTRSSRTETRERRENDERERSRERRRERREERETATRVLCKGDVFHPLMSLYISPYFLSSKVTLNSPKTLN